MADALKDPGFTPALDHEESAMTEMLNRCRCGSRPRVIYDGKIAPGSPSWAIMCQAICGADTHWQPDFAMARNLWNAGKVRNQRGGQHSGEERVVQ